MYKLHDPAAAILATVADLQWLADIMLRYDVGNKGDQSMPLLRCQTLEVLAPWQASLWLVSC